MESFGQARPIFAAKISVRRPSSKRKAESPDLRGFVERCRIGRRDDAGCSWPPSNRKELAPYA